MRITNRRAFGSSAMYPTTRHPAPHSLNVQCLPRAERSREMPPADHLDRIVLRSQATLPYHHNQSPGNAPATLAVVVVHGINRNAHDYFRSIVRAAVDIGVITQTLIIAPQFQIEQDAREAQDAYWTDSGRSSWKDGGGAVQPLI